MCVTNSNLTNTQVVELEQLLREQVTIYNVALNRVFMPSGRGGGGCGDGV